MVDAISAKVSAVWASWAGQSQPRRNSCGHAKGKIRKSEFMKRVLMFPISKTTGYSARISSRRKSYQVFLGHEDIDLTCSRSGKARPDNHRQRRQEVGQIDGIKICSMIEFVSAALRYRNPQRGEGVTRVTITQIICIGACWTLPVAGHRAQRPPIPPEKTTQKRVALYAGQDGEKRTIRGYLPGQQTKRDITFTVVGGRAIFEGDVDLGNAGSIQSRLARPLLTQDEMANWKKTPRAKGRMAVRIGGIIYGQKAGFPTPLTPRVLEAKERGSKGYQTGNQTPQSPHQPSYCAQEKSDRNYIRFRYLQRRCSSPVGMQGKAQDINIDPSGCPWPSVAHEILHSAGFWHTQSRADRDKHIRIQTQNIRPGSGHNFSKHPGRVRTGKLGSLMSPTMFTR